MNRSGNRLVTTEVMEGVDRDTIERLGIPGSSLMENAGQKAWREVSARIGDTASKTVVFIAGNGNNGGDSLVMARQCFVEGVHRPHIITIRADLRGAAAEQWSVLSHLGLTRTSFETDRDTAVRIIHEADCIVDGITGTGLTSPLRAIETAIVSEINAAVASVFAVDLPSGMRDGGAHGEVTVSADVTICTGYRKRCLYAPARRSGAGEIVWVDPGFPDVEFFTDASWYPRQATFLVPDSAVEECVPLITDVPRDAHKGGRGRLLIVAGGAGTEGAAILAAGAATAAGVGMVAVHTSERAVGAGLSAQPGAMWRSGIPTGREISWCDGLVVGPGWTDGTVETLAGIVAAAQVDQRPIVLDAAALRIVAAHLRTSDKPLWSEAGPGPAPVVLTPHPGELADLAGVELADVLAAPFDVLDGVARTLRWMGDVTVVLKSSATIIRRVDGDFQVVDGRCPALGMAGSGDVLSGIIGGRIAAARSAHGDAEKGAIDGVLEHLLRGRRLAAELGTFSARRLSERSIFHRGSDHGG